MNLVAKFVPQTFAQAVPTLLNRLKGLQKSLISRLYGQK
ncbi:hypothetical protein C4J89_2391 [Pseudomonas sp. R4-35-07]|nr:hypothetical protein C4J91_2422 [Pseudomonas sp. R3-52-08]AZF31866.1 hypothetical protein C4J89_2391 [Pseudomonas sp. R4-35-07]